MKVLLLIICTALFCFNAVATHIIGGEMHYRHLGSDAMGQDSFRVTLKLYRDCNPGAAAFDNTITIAVYKYTGGSTSLFATLNIPFPGSISLPNNADDPCISIPSTICVEQAVYETIVALPANADGYSIVWQRCCRSTTVQNLVTPGDIGSTYHVFIPGAPYHQNSDPLYNEFPPTVICINTPLAFDHAAFDFDNDSLVYELCAPYAGGTIMMPIPNPPAPPPYTFVPYTGNFSAQNPLPANPSLHINPATGLLTGTPTATGQYVVGICVKEYRNGVLLGEHKRDFQFNVISCNSVAGISAVSPHVIICSGDTVSIFANAASPVYWYPNLYISDSTSNTPLVYPDSSIMYYVVTNPSPSCSDTAQVFVQVYNNVVASVSPPQVSITAGQSAILNASGGGLYSWQPASGLSMTNGATVVASPIVSTTYTVTATAGSCTDTQTVAVTVLPLSHDRIPIVHAVSFPNPVKDQLTLTIPNAGSSAVTLFVSAIGGGFHPIAGVQTGDQINIDVSQLPAGLYQLLIRSHDATRITKFVIVN